MNYNKIVSCALSPNTEIDDVVVALRTLVSPWKWQEGVAKKWVYDWFSRYCNTKNLIFTTSGRTACCMLLEALGIGKGDEVLLQPFTCVAVPNSILWVGATPVYVDIDTTYNIDPSKIEEKITKKTKAIIVQHTFGIPADMDSLIAIKNKYNILLIEDCAHSLGVTYHGKKLGTLGDGAFFSFGRDKIVSSVWGGVAVLYKNIPMPKYSQNPSYFWILQQLLHPILFSIILPLYNVGVGKIFLWFLMKMHILSYPVVLDEKKAYINYPNALATLLQNQLTKLDQYNLQRKKIIDLYNKAFHTNTHALLRFPLIVDDPAQLRRNAKKQGILLGNWYSNIIDPIGVDLKSVGYTRGSCPISEHLANHTINYPTRISPVDVSRIIQI